MYRRERFGTTSSQIITCDVERCLFTVKFRGKNYLKTLKRDARNTPCIPVVQSSSCTSGGLDCRIHKTQGGVREKENNPRKKKKIKNVPEALGGSRTYRHTLRTDAKKYGGHGARLSVAGRLLQVHLVHEPHVLLHAKVVHEFALAHVTPVTGLDAALVRYVPFQVFHPLVRAAAQVRARDPFASVVAAAARVPWLGEHCAGDRGT